MFNYNLINPININYRNPKQDPYANKDENGKSSLGEGNTPVSLDDPKRERHFPNGNKVQIDYTKNKVNIAQVLEDFRSTIAAINAPKEIADEVNVYLGLVEAESKKENPSREIVLSNLRNASKISDKFIEESLKKPSSVVEDWVNALFMQNVELKSDPTFINEDFRVQIPEKSKAKVQTQNYAAPVPQAQAYNVSSYEAPQAPAQTGNLDIVSKQDDILSLGNTAGVNIYDIPQNKITINEIKPIGQADPAFFEEVPAAPVAPVQTPTVQEFTPALPETFSEAEIEQDNLTYSTTAADESAVIAPIQPAVSFERVPEVYKITTVQEPQTKGQVIEVQPIRQMSEEEKAARSSFVRAKRMIKENGSPESAIKLYDEALSLVENSSDVNLKAAIHFERGKVYDDFDFAESALQDYNCATKCSDNNLKTHAHIKMGQIYDDYIMFDPALQHYSLAIESAEEAQNPAGKAKALRHLAALFADRYDKENTETFNMLALDAARDTGNTKTLAKTYREAAQNLEYVGEDVKALKMYKEAAKLLYQNQDYATLSINYEEASAVMERLGNGAKAMSLLSKAFEYQQKAELQSAYRAAQA